MKKSRYNFIREFGSQCVLYNARTEALAVLDRVVSDLYSANTPEEIKAIHPDFYDYLVNKGFVLDKGVDELTEVINDWSKEDNATDYFTLTVNPTLGCNLCCWYCYENHVGNLNMTSEVVSRIKKLITSKLSEPQLEFFHLGFFGGEPLLNFTSIGKDLLEFACSECVKFGKKMSASFVTNGVLLSKEILDYLNNKGTHVDFQITLDGNEDTHDSIRYTRSGAKTYRKILANALEILKYPNMDLVLRCNYTEKTIATFIDVADDLSVWGDIDGVNMAHLKVDMHRVWQDKERGSSDAILNMEQQVRMAFKSGGVPVTIVQPANRYRCYAERNNNVLVNFNGDLYRCTARDFIPERRDGVISELGELIWNGKSEKRDQIKWSNKTCHSCNIYPLCCGTCSQSKLENRNLGGCDYDYSGGEKDKIVTDRIMWLLEQSKQSTSATTNY